MKFFWIMPLFLLQGAEAFLVKNAKGKLCLQASPMRGNVSLEDCKPESDFQQWSWQGRSLVNRGTRSCLSLVGAGGVGTGPCGSTSWGCSGSLLSPLGSSQGYLVASRRGVTLGNVRGLKAQWQDGADRSVCEQQAAKAERGGSVLAALASTRGYEHTAASVILALGIDREELEELLWFFRREDPSRWNYSILALSFLALVLGLLLLAVNITRNRKRKIHLDGQAARAAELEATRALVPVQQELPAQDQKAGDVVVQWKDGTITSLFTESSEDPV